MSALPPKAEVGDLRGKQLDARGLSAWLRKYDIKPKQIRVGNWTGKGYEPSDFADAWLRYLGPPSGKSETQETSETLAEFRSPVISDVSDVSLLRERDPKKEIVEDEAQGDPFAIPANLDRRPPREA